MGFQYLSSQRHGDMHRHRGGAAQRNVGENSAFHGTLHCQVHVRCVNVAVVHLDGWKVLVFVVEERDTVFDHIDQPSR